MEFGEIGRWSPDYLILRLPGEPKEEFVLLIPFNPSKRDNLSAWLAAGVTRPTMGSSWSTTTSPSRN